jgi:prepilin-type N-terminal cleavage/methylation domain-containing protein
MARRVNPYSVRPFRGRRPRCRRCGAGLRGVTLVEMLVVIGVLTVLMSVLIPVVSSARKSQKSVVCLSTLRNLGSALNAYAMEHQGRMPDPGTSDQSWEKLIAPYYGGGTLCCPADLELFPTVGSSYDWRDTGKDSTTMAGKLIADVRRPGAILAMEALPGWHRKGFINIVRLNGSAEAIEQQTCFKDLADPLRPGK